MRRLRICPFGRFEVQVEDQLIPPSAWRGHKARQLFKILITYHPQSVASDQLIEWLWPHLTPDSARNSLWVAISRLRRLLEPDAAGVREPTFVVTDHLVIVSSRADGEPMHTLRIEADSETRS